MVPLLFSVLVLTGCKVMMPSDYKKVKDFIIEDCSKLNLHGKVTITDLHWTALESPTYHVSYIYSEKTYDGQTIKLEEKDRTIHENKSPNSYGSNLNLLFEYKDVLSSRNLSKKRGEKN